MDFHNIRRSPGGSLGGKSYLLTGFLSPPVVMPLYFPDRTLRSITTNLTYQINIDWYWLYWLVSVSLLGFSVHYVFRPQSWNTRNLGLWLTRDGITYMGQNKYVLEETLKLRKCPKKWRKWFYNVLLKQTHRTDILHMPFLLLVSRAIPLLMS